MGRGHKWRSPRFDQSRFIPSGVVYLTHKMPTQNSRCHLQTTKHSLLPRSLGLQQAAMTISAASELEPQSQLHRRHILRSPLATSLLLDIIAVSNPDSKRRTPIETCRWSQVPPNHATSICQARITHVKQQVYVQIQLIAQTTSRVRLSAKPHLSSASFHQIVACHHHTCHCHLLGDQVCDLRPLHQSTLLAAQGSVDPHSISLGLSAVIAGLRWSRTVRILPSGSPLILHATRPPKHRNRSIMMSISKPRTNMLLQLPLTFTPNSPFPEVEFCSVTPKDWMTLRFLASNGNNQCARPT